MAAKGGIDMQRKTVFDGLIGAAALVTAALSAGCVAMGK